MRVSKAPHCLQVRYFAPQLSHIFSTDSATNGYCRCRMASRAGVNVAPPHSSQVWGSESVPIVKTKLVHFINCSILNCEHFEYNNRNTRTIEFPARAG